MAEIRFRQRHVQQTVADYVEQTLRDLGWLDDPAPWGIAPIDLRDVQPGEITDFAPTIVSTVVDIEPARELMQLGGGLWEVNYRIVVDVYAEKGSIAVSIASDIRDGFEDASTSLVDYSADAPEVVSGALLEFWDPQVVIAGGGTSTLPDLKLAWRSVAVNVMLTFDNQPRLPNGGILNTASVTGVGTATASAAIEARVVGDVTATASAIGVGTAAALGSSEAAAPPPDTFGTATATGVGIATASAISYLPADAPGTATATGVGSASASAITSSVVFATASATGVGAATGAATSEVPPPMTEEEAWTASKAGSYFVFDPVDDQPQAQGSGNAPASFIDSSGNNFPTSKGTNGPWYGTRAGVDLYEFSAATGTHMIVGAIADIVGPYTLIWTFINDHGANNSWHGLIGGTPAPRFEDRAGVWSYNGFSLGPYDQTWHTIMAVSDGANSEIYFDGTPMGAPSSIDQTIGNDWHIGKWPGEGNSRTHIGAFTYMSLYDGNLVADDPALADALGAALAARVGITWKSVVNPEVFATATATGVGTATAAATSGAEAAARHDVIMADGPVAYWPLNETSGNAREFIGNTAAVAYTGSPTQSVDGVEFDGTAATLPLGNYGTLGNRSIEFWVTPRIAIDYTTSGNGESLTPISFKSSGGTNRQAIVFGSFTSTISNELVTLLDGNTNNYRLAWTTTGDSFAADVPIHVVVTINSGSAAERQILINGVKVNNTVFGTYSNRTWDNMTLGTDDEGHFMEGFFHDVAIYDRILTVAEALEHYQAPAGDRASLAP